ncbi:MAG: hypothetical protein AAGA58_15015 [Verrucomicrobiota bacterium]
MNPPEIENYRLTELLSKDPTGTTWVAFDEKSEAVAVKVFNPDAVNFSLMEAGLSRQLMHHPHPRVAEILDYDFTVDSPYLVTPLYATKSETEDDEEKNSSWEPRTPAKIEDSLGSIEAWRYIYQLADALAHLHRIRAPHMGLRIESIFLDSDEESPQLVLGGSGQGIVAGLKALDAGDLIPYAPPEQLRMPEIYRDRRAERWDVYAFGVVAFRLLNKSFPRGAEFVEELAKRREENDGAPIPVDLGQCATMVESQDEIKWSTPAEDSVEERRRRVLEACLSLNPESRYLDMREVREVFCGLEDQLAHATELESAVAREAEAKRKMGNARKIAAVFAAIAAALGAMAFLKNSEGPDEATNLASNEVQSSAQTPANSESSKSGATTSIPSAEKGNTPANGSPPATTSAPYLDQLRETTASVDELFQAIASQGIDEQGDSGIPDGVLGAILSHYQQFTQSAGDNPDLALEIARAHAISGELLLGLGNPVEAVPELEKAVAGFTALRKSDTKNGSHLLNLAFTSQSLAIAHNDQGFATKAIETAQESHLHFLDISRRNPDSPRATRSLAQNKLFLARLLHDSGRSAEGGIPLDGARKLYERLASKTQATGDDIADVAKIDSIEAEIEVSLGNPEEAIQLHIRSVDDLLPLTSKEPNNLGYQFQLAESYGALSDLVADNGDTQASEEANTQAIGILADLASRAPANVEYRAALAARFEAAAALERDSGQQEQALSSQEKAIELYGAIVKEHPNDHENRHLLAWAQSRQADLLTEAKKTKESTIAATAAVNEMQHVLTHDLNPERDNAKRSSHRRDLARLYEKLARHWSAQKNSEGAAKCYEKAVEHWDTLARNGGANDKEVTEGLAAAKAELEKLQGS